MSGFSVPIVRVEEIIPIEGADKIEAVRIGDYQTITLKGEYKPGDLVAYIPEQSVVPEELLEEMGLKGKLSGKEKNRVKAVKLKGVLSQGLVYPHARVVEKWQATLPEPQNGEVAGWRPPLEGDSVADILGITKYEPPVPAQFAGQLVRPRGDYSLINYDIENIKAWPNVLQDGEEVVFTEKIHGTFMQAAFFPESDFFGVSSKGLGARGFVIEDTEQNASNIYLRTAKKFDLENKLRYLYTLLMDMGFSGLYAVFVLGEVFGKGVQDLNYSTDLGFRTFDIYAGIVGQGGYLNVDQFSLNAEAIGLQTVPFLYRGPFSKEVLNTFTSGVETVSGTESHLREGVVVRPVRERQHRGLGRVILKSVSENYLLRKGGTEYN